MGYCIDMTDSNFTIKKENFGKALAALKSVFIQENMTCHDSINGERIPHFSWVSTTCVLSSLCLDEALAHIRYVPIHNKTGDICDVRFTGEKWGNEEIFFNALAPFVESDSHLNFVGEDGIRWQWYFDGRTVELKDMPGEES